MTEDDVREREALQLQFPFLATLDVPAGWLPVVERMAERLAGVVLRGRWQDRIGDEGFSLEAREKWGILLASPWGAGDARTEVDRITEAAEDESVRTCQHAHCVLPARRLVGPGGWLVTACRDHAPPGATAAGEIRRYGFGG